MEFKRITRSQSSNITSASDGVAAAGTDGSSVDPIPAAVSVQVPKTRKKKKKSSGSSSSSSSSAPAPPTSHQVVAHSGVGVVPPASLEPIQEESGSTTPPSHDEPAGTMAMEKVAPVPPRLRSKKPDQSKSPLPRLLTTLTKLKNSSLREQISKFMYAERVKSFTDGNWPNWDSFTSTSSTSYNSAPATTDNNPEFSKKRKLQDSPSVPTLPTSAFDFTAIWIQKANANAKTCSAQELALAGFYLVPEKSVVKCFVCQGMKSLEQIDKSSDPWKIHEDINRACGFLKFGRRQADDFSVEEALFLIGECHVGKLESEMAVMEDQAKKAIEVLEDITRKAQAKAGAGPSSGTSQAMAMTEAVADLEKEAEDVFYSFCQSSRQSDK